MSTSNTSERFRDTAETIADSLLDQADAIISTTPSAPARRELYIASAAAGNPQYAVDGRLWGSQWEAHNEWERSGISLTPEQRRAGSLIKAIGVLGKLKYDGHEVEETANRFARLNDRLNRRNFSERHHNAMALLDGGFRGPNDALIHFYKPDEVYSMLRSAHKRDVSAGFVKDYLWRVTKNGMDTILENSSAPFDDMCKAVWNVEGKDPSFFGFTYYLAQAYAEAGNTKRAMELRGMLTSPDKQTALGITIASRTDKRIAREFLIGEATQVIKAQLKGSDRELSLAEYYASQGQLKTALLYMQNPRYNPVLQANLWAQIYRVSGRQWARANCIESWKSNFIPWYTSVPNPYLRGVESILAGDESAGYTDVIYGQQVPRFAAQMFKYPLYGDLGLCCEEIQATIVNRLGKQGRIDTISAIIEHDYQGDDPLTARNRVLGITAAAIGLRAAARTPHIDMA